MEEQGTAWARVQEAVEQGYPEPTWEPRGPVLRVLVPKHPLFSISQEVAETIEKTEKTEDGRSTQARQRRERILEVLRYHAPADLALNEIPELIGASLATTYRDVDALREQGLVRPTARGRIAISEPR